MLATLVDLVQRDGLDKLDDDQLTGVLQAANRLAPPTAPPSSPMTWSFVFLLGGNDGEPLFGPEPQ